MTSPANLLPLPSGFRVAAKLRPVKVLRRILTGLGVLALVLVVGVALFWGWASWQSAHAAESFEPQARRMIQVCAARLRAQPGVTGHLADKRAGYGSTQLDAGGRITWEVLGEWQSGERTRLFECQGTGQGKGLMVTRVAFVEK